MSEHTMLLVSAMICLAAVNIAALHYLSFAGLFLTAASLPLAMKILEMIK